MGAYNEVCSCNCCGHQGIPAEKTLAADTPGLLDKTFTVEGLDCADCAAKLEKRVERLPGIKEVQLNFATAKLKVVYDQAIANETEIMKAVIDSGYQVAMQQASHGTLSNHSLVYRIEGLDCADCAAKLEKKILNMAGVQTAIVNFGAGKLTVHHSLTDNDIIKAVQDAGYQAIREQGIIHRPAGEWWRRPRTAATIMSGVLLGVAMLAEGLAMPELLVLTLYLSAMIVGGYHVAKSGLYGLKSLTLDTNFLMTIAAIGAVAIGEYSEGATVVFLFSLGNTLQSYTLDKTRESIRALMELAPREALVQRNGQEIQLPIEEIIVGDRMIVKPGERIAMDGTIVSGTSTVNQAAITGESMPVDKQTGDAVYAGTMNEQGALEIQVTKLAGDSTLAKIMHMVEDAQAEKAPMQQFVDVFAKFYTPAVIVISLGLMIVPPLLANQPFDLWFYRALVLLVISCPCALVISTPVSIVSAIGNASRRGVLIKGGIHLEQMGKIRAVAFDKTGTLTTGTPVVTDVISLANLETETVISLAAAVEKWSEHPLAQAIVRRAKELAIDQASSFQALIGQGAQAEVQGQTVYVGNRRLFAKIGHPLDLLEDQLTALEQQGKTTMLVGTDKEILGIVAVADTLRADSGEALRSLRAAGVQTVAMLTGDNRQVAAAIAGQLNIETVYSELLPEDKVSALKQMAEQYGSVAMVGDGVNDAPALATANVGIAMGVAGSDTALETADIALMSDDLSKLAYVVQLSRKTVAIIKQNISFSVVIKLLFVLGTFAGFVNLWLAVIADTGAALLVTLNGMRLAREIK